MADLPKELKTAAAPEALETAAPEVLETAAAPEALEMVLPPRDETPRQFKFAAMAARKRFSLQRFLSRDSFPVAIGTMLNVLVKSKLHPSTAKWELWKTLEEAGALAQADQRRKQCAFSHRQAERDLNLLVKHLEMVAQEILHGPPVSRDALRVLITQSQAQFLDTESFLELIQSIHEVLHPEGDPARNRWCEIGNLWEAIRPVTRNAVEAELRRSPELRAPNDFVQNVAALLRRFAPKRAKKTAVTYKFGLSIGKRWTALGLTVGTAHDWKTGKDIESLFQRYCSAALYAVGSQFTISRRQVNLIRITLKS